MDIFEMIEALSSKCNNINEEIRTKFNLSLSEYHFLCNIEPGEKHSGIEIAEKLDLSPSRISRIIEKLVIGGFLNRKVSKSDRRLSSLFLTEKGRILHDEIQQKKKQCNDEVSKSLSKTEKEQFEKIVLKLLNKA